MKNLYKGLQDFIPGQTIFFYNVCLNTINIVDTCTDYQYGVNVALIALFSIGCVILTLRPANNSPLRKLMLDPNLTKRALYIRLTIRSIMAVLAFLAVSLFQQANIICFYPTLDTEVPRTVPILLTAFFSFIESSLILSDTANLQKVNTMRNTNQKRAYKFWMLGG